MRPETLVARLGRVQAAMDDAGVAALLLSLGADLPWLTGYTAMPLERLTMLVVPTAPSGERPTLVVPELEAPRVAPCPDLFSVRAWAETEDPVAIVTALVEKSTPAEPLLAISDRAWAGFLLGFQEALPGARWVAASTVTSPLRAIKDDAEVESIAKAAAAADRVAADLLSGRVKLVGRTEREVSAELTRRLLEQGHDKVNFAIVASGPNSASPHHEPTGRQIGPNEAVVCDFGGTLDGYCSDITRTVFTGPPGPELARVFEVVAKAQEAAMGAVRLGAPCSEVDAAARDVVTDAGFGPYFIHRTGHGIGLEEHEAPYMVAGNPTPVAAGHVFSIEPGVYIPGRYGVRTEDIVAATAGGLRRLNQADHALCIVQG